MTRATMGGYGSRDVSRKSGQRIKRGIDVVGAAIGLLICSPLLAAVALAVRVKLGRPVFYKQIRPGLNGKPFTLIKFRTMREAYDGQGYLLPDAERLTSFGRFLRSTSLDELPELWNVLSGELSLVGPRPLLVQYLVRYTPEQARRHEMKPGITGWAQINGRNAISWERKFEHDVWYVDNWSLRLDVMIIGLTMVKVLKRKDISEQGQATMGEFTTGNQSK